jgi:hypothetical protein
VDSSVFFLLKKEIKIMGPLTKKAKQAVAVAGVTPAILKSMTTSTGFFQEKMVMAQQLSMSSLVPQQFKGKPADCMIAMEMAEQMRMPFFTIIQNLDIIHGKTGWKSVFVSSAINASKRYASNLSYEWKGSEGKDDWGCRVFVKEHSGTKLYGPWVTIKMAKAEGWVSKSGSKWQTMPELMMQYRAVSFFGRVHASDLLLGMQSVDEIIDVEPVTQETVAASKQIPTQLEEVDVEVIPQADASYDELVGYAISLGFEVSGPTEGKPGEFWLKAEAVDLTADVNELQSLGFKPHKGSWVMNVTHMLEGVKNAS